MTLSIRYARFNEAYLSTPNGTPPGIPGPPAPGPVTPEVPFDSSIDLADRDFTLATWIRYAEKSKQGAIFWAFRIRGLMAVDRFNITVQSTSAYNDGLWHHVVLERANRRLALIVDGTEVSSAAAADGSVTAGKEYGVQGMHVGQRVDGADRFNGSVDEVRVYRRALSTDELTLLREQNASVKGRLGLRLPLETVNPS